MNTPAFNPPLHVGRPNIPPMRQVERRLAGAVSRRWLSNDGMLVREFEAALARRLDVESCVLASSGTAALGLTLRALACGGTIAMPSFTFLGTVRSIEWLGIRPAFIDIRADDHLVDPDAVVPFRARSDVEAVIAVDLWGQTCQDVQLQECTSPKPLIIDVAHSLGSLTPAGCASRAATALVGSLHATKIATSGEGGFIGTNDARLADTARSMRNFGFAGADVTSGPGTNAKMSEINAAFGLASLECLDQYIEANRSNFVAYDEVFSTSSLARLIPVAANAHANCQYVVIEVDARHRDALITHLESHNVYARRYFYPGCHQLVDGPSEPCPVTDEVAARTVALPTGTAVSPGDARCVAQMVLEFLASAPA